MNEYLTQSKRRQTAQVQSSGGTLRLEDRRSHHLPAQLKDLRSQDGLLQGARQRTAGGLPQQLASGIESLSGVSMAGVRVHYNSSKPARMQAHAYAQGSDIHLASGQEKHLPHEAWHVVQQAQGRVRPTLQMKGVGINDNAGLESEADRMGQAALRAGQS